jgi:hypothetical protein
MTITVDPPEDAAAVLNERAEVEGSLPAEFAAEVLAERFQSDYEGEFPLDAEAVQKIRRSRAEIDAGQALSLEEARADFKATFAGGHANRSAE